MNLKSRTFALAAGITLVCTLPAWAHAGKPHGPHKGEMLVVKGYTIEFVKRAKGEDGTFDVYVQDAKKAPVTKGDVAST